MQYSSSSSISEIYLSFGPRPKRPVLLSFSFSPEREVGSSHRHYKEPKYEGGGGMKRGRRGKTLYMTHATCVTTTEEDGE